MASPKTRGEKNTAGKRPRSRRYIVSTAEVYAHALAIEQEAVSSYREFAQRMEDLGNELLAGLFRRLEAMENDHLRTLTAKTAGMALPVIPRGEYAWLDSGAPLPEAHDLVFRMMTPRVALELALAAEHRAKQFFESVCESARERDIYSLARAFADEEQIHIDTVQFALGGLPGPYEPAAQVR